MLLNMSTFQYKTLLLLLLSILRFLYLSNEPIFQIDESIYPHFINNMFKAIVSPIGYFIFFTIFTVGEVIPSKFKRYTAIENSLKISLLLVLVVVHYWVVPVITS